MLAIVIELVGGLGLFIYGMNLMSRGIERVAGNKLRDILKTFIKTKFLGLIVGLFFTAVIQSSSAATVMVVSFVNSGIMTLVEASGVILGANIGTCVTSMLVAFKLSAIAPVIIFAGAIMANFIKKPIVRKIGDIVLGFGILFLGISTMSSAMATLREIPAVIDTLSHFTNPFLACLVGVVITSVVQSSSVTVSILVVMASQGLVDLHICMYFIIGCNIGACTSAVLASLSGTKNAKRAAFIHLLFNVFGTILLFVLVAMFGGFIENIVYFFSGHGQDSANLGRNIAWTHLLFKVFMVIVFYPFMNWIIRLTERIFPGEDTLEEDGNGRFATHYISTANPNPSIAIYLATQEITRMGQMAIKNLNTAVDCLITGNLDKNDEILETEGYIDYLNIRISDYLVKANNNNLPIGDAKRIAGYFHVVSDIERIGDHADNIREAAHQIVENGISFSQESIDELKIMIGKIDRMFNDSMEMFGEHDETHMQEIRDLEDQVDEMEKTMQAAHISRMSQGLCSAEAGLFFSDIVSGLERVGDHAINIAFSLHDSEEKETAKHLR